MLLDQLADDQQAVVDARRALHTALVNRNRTVQDCRSIKLPMSTIGKITGLSPQRITVIQAKNLDDDSPSQLDSAAMED